MLHFIDLETKLLVMLVNKYQIFILIIIITISNNFLIASFIAKTSQFRAFFFRAHIVHVNSSYLSNQNFVMTIISINILM